MREMRSFVHAGVTRSEALNMLDRAWSAFAGGTTTFPRFALAFEEAVRMVEEAGDPLAQHLRRIWGQVEIINALALDEGRPVSAADLDDTASLVLRARELLEGHS